MAGASTTAAVAVLVTVLVVTSVPALVGNDASPTPSPERSPSATESPRPTESGDWQALVLPPFEPVAELMPDSADGSGISANGTFTFRSHTERPAVELAAGLRVEPPTELLVEAGPSADVAIVRPSEPLYENARYRFQLLAPDGSLAAQWSFRTGGPLHVVRRLPNDRSTQVPADTGIEIEFDQDDVVGVAQRFSVDPPAPGHFEAHGRTWVYVPTSPLEPATLYTVTLASGVGIEGSDQVLEADVEFQFETASTDDEAREPWLVFLDVFHEVRPGDAPVIPVAVHDGLGDAEAFTPRVDVYQLDTVDAAVDVAVILSADRGWATRSSNGNVATTRLSQIATFDAIVVKDQVHRYLRLPNGLAEGWYLVEVVQARRSAQLLLQVTDLAAYALTSATRTITWVNDLDRGAPVAGATVTLAGGATLGQTDVAGLLDRISPEPLATDTARPEPLLLVVSVSDGRRIIAPIIEDRGYYRQDGGGARWWHLFGTDRLQYRQDDTIRAWGLIRSRADGSVPTDVELRLVTVSGRGGPPIARVPVAATARGVFVGEMPLRRLPTGEYRLGMFVDGEPVSYAHLAVADLRKPAFRIDVTTERRVHLHGDTVQARAIAAFYDGSAAPGLRLRMSGHGASDDLEEVVKADPSGVAHLSFPATAEDGRTRHGYVYANTAQPEEGSSSGEASFVVFPSAVWLTADATVADGMLTIDGRLNTVDLASAESQLEESGTIEDPSGEAVGGRPVSIQVDHVSWVPRQAGTRYDFLEKKAVPEFEYDRVVTWVSSQTPTSRGDGAFAVTIRAAASAGMYQVGLSALDELGRAVQLVLHVDAARVEDSPSAWPYLEEPSGCGYPAVRTAGIGESVSLTIREGDGSPIGEGRTLFVVGRLGIDQAVVTSEPTIRRQFGASDLPSVTVRAVRLSESGYLVTNDAQIEIRRSDMQIDVSLEPDRTAYRPGEEARLTIRTIGPDGSPIPADVVVRALDAKLFAIRAAEEIDGSRLMSPVSAGFIGSYASHRVMPPDACDGFGAAGGGDDDEPREDFADVAAFQLVTTDDDGRGSVRFQLPDDLTSWDVAAIAIADGLEAGTTSIEIPVGLPFFVDATIASEYLAGERPVVQLRAYGASLAEGDAVRFTFASPSLGLVEATIDGQAFEPVTVALPVLSSGEHRLAIAAERIGTDVALRDSIVRVVKVVPTRLRTLLSTYEPLTGGFAAPGGDGLTTYVVTDAGRGALLGVLESLAWGATARLDTSLAADEARRLLIDEFGIGASRLPDAGFDATRAGTHGLALLPHDSPDLFLSARTALIAPERVTSRSLREALTTWAHESTATRERRIVALAGLAGLGGEVLGELRGVDVDALTVRERLWLALGLLAGGDIEAARSIERSILAAHGRRLGPWVRLELSGRAADAHEATALMLSLASGLGDPIAGDISRYLLSNPSSERVVVLEQLGFARTALEWLPRATARFAWTVDGDRHEETLRAGGAFTMTLTADQRRSLRLERLEGDLVIGSFWLGEAQYDALPADPLVRIERKVSPDADAPSDDLVHVELIVAFGTDAPEGCFQVTDLVPSGLAPLVTPRYGTSDVDVLAPYEVVGQRVSWCIGPGEEHVRRLGYSARVVSAGSYRWEPAVVQFVTAPSVGAATPVATYEIRAE